MQEKASSVCGRIEIYVWSVTRQALLPISARALGRIFLSIPQTRETRNKYKFYTKIILTKVEP